MPATAEVDLYNLALRHVGSSVEVQSTTENSSEANTCRRFYAQTRDEILSDFPWPFAKVTTALALVATDPTTEWAYAYRYPVDCLTMGRILPDYPARTQAERIPFAIGKSGSSTLIYTDRASAVAEYIATVTDPTTFAPPFAQAVAWKLAWYIAPSVTGGDPSKLGDRAYQNYLKAVENAMDNAANEEQPPPAPQSEFMLARN